MFVRKLLFAALGFLLLAGASILVLRVGYHSVPPLVAASGRGDLETVKGLLASGADIEGHGSGMFRWTPLLCATATLQTNVVQLLLENGASVYYKDIFGKTALMWALQGDNCTNLVKLLIQYGSDVNATDKYGITVIEHARAASCPAIVELLRAAGAKETP